MTLFYRFAVALGIGILIGLQRESAYQQEKRESELPVNKFAGIRTFPLIALLGCLSALISDQFQSGIVFMAGVLVVGLLIALAYHATSRVGDFGLTTEIAGILIFFIGALCYWNDLLLAVALGVVTMGLLSLKLELHKLARRITQDDLLATLKFAVIAAILLPLLPKEPIAGAPFDVIVPYKVGLMIVFISGIGFLGYILIQFMGTRQGIGLSGFLGGLVSSTAVTLTFAQRSKTDTGLAKPFALAIIVAWTVMFVRVMVEVAVVNAPLLWVVWLPIVASGLLGLGYGVYLWRSDSSDSQKEDVKVSNPFELTPAIQFGLLYAVILLGANVARIYFGNAGIYLSAILSGLADVDAITLSMSDLSREGGSLDMQTAARAIVYAVMSNTVVKGGIVLLSGGKSLRKVMLPGFLLILVTGVTLSFFI
jgi:uncharacterized membrane protein (DUF4010 family)